MFATSYTKTDSISYITYLCHTRKKTYTGKYDCVTVYNVNRYFLNVKQVFLLPLCVVTIASVMWLLTLNNQRNGNSVLTAFNEAAVNNAVCAVDDSLKICFRTSVKLQ